MTQLSCWNNISFMTIKLISLQHVSYNHILGRINLHFQLKMSKGSTRHLISELAGFKTFPLLVKARVLCEI